MTAEHTLLGSHRRTITGFAALATVLVALGAAAEENRLIVTPDRPFPALTSRTAPADPGFAWVEPSALPLQQVFRAVHPDAPLPGMSELVVRIETGGDASAPIRIDLFGSAHDYALRREAPSEHILEPGEAALPLDLPVGDYALRAYRDDNGNGRLDTNALGQPVEPVAYSNSARRLFGEPEWDRTRFRLTGGRNSVELSLE